MLQILTKTQYQPPPNSQKLEGLGFRDQKKSFKGRAPDGSTITQNIAKCSEHNASSAGCVFVAFEGGLGFWISGLGDFRA